MTGGQSPIGYLKAYMTNLYLSKDSKKVQEAIEEGKLMINTQMYCNNYSMHAKLKYLTLSFLDCVV